VLKLSRSLHRAPIVLAILLAILSVSPTLAAANTTPTANGQAVSVPFGSASALTLTGTDPDGPAPLTFAIVANPTHGTLSALNPATGAVTYTPAAGYSGADSFAFTVNDGVATSTPALVQITVSQQPTVSLSATSLGFGEQPVGTASGAQTVTLTNTSMVPLTIASITASGDFTRTFTCLSTLAPGASCSISVSFTPTALGLRSGTLMITDNAVGSPQTVALGGTGTANSPFAVLTTTTNGNGVVELAPGGTPTGPPGATTYPRGASVTATARPNSGYLFTGWTFDSAFAGWANPLTLTMNGNHALAATFAVVPTFSDVPDGQPFSRAVMELAARGTIRGYGDGRFGPGDTVLRAHTAALIARAANWDAEDWGNPFPDRGVVDADLWRNVGAVAHYGVTNGFPDGTFRPVDPVLYSQAISFISRAMVVKGFWVLQPDDPALYPNVPASSGHRRDLATFVNYAGALPDFPVGGQFGAWDQPASRGWFARALYQALNSYFGVDRVP